MTNYDTQFGWTKPPSRDEALDLMYDFIRAIKKMDLAKAGQLVLVKDMNFFIQSLHASLLKYLEMVVEDEEWDRYADKNLAFEVDDPDSLSEDDTMPEFSGREFNMEAGEEVSFFLGLHSTVTPIRLHFALVEADALYFLKLQRITAK